MGSRKIVLGMSGGVDSSMSLLLLRKQGWEPVGVSLKLPAWEKACALENECGRENACCTTDSLRIAASVCKKLGVEHHIYDVQDDFRHKVMDYLVSELRQGRTPNPCAECNRVLKFPKLFEWAHEHGIEYVATGHYARSRLNPETGMGELLRPADISKDQTYGMCFLSGTQLRHIVFPLGDLLKTEVYEMAKKEGFELFLKKKQSQDLCFVSGDELPKFIAEKIGKKPGAIRDTSGKRLGEHKGLHFYTVGQRRGLGLAGGSFFVKSMDHATNTLIVTRDRREIMQSDAMLASVRFISGKSPSRRIPLLAQTRHRQAPVEASLHLQDGDKARVLFKEPIEAVTPGQVCALYSKDLCLGGGIIIG